MTATVSISIVGRNYEISCDEGQEDYLKMLAADVDRRAAQLLRSVGQVGDARLLVMVTLLMADEITELRRGTPGGVPAGPVVDEAIDTALGESLDALAQRVEAIADRLEKA